MTNNSLGVKQTCVSCLGRKDFVMVVIVDEERKNLQETEREQVGERGRELGVRNLHMRERG